MRDPKRIVKILTLIDVIWNKVPDWRLGQLLFNCAGFPRGDPFFYEDDKVIENLEKFIKEYLIEVKNET